MTLWGSSSTIVCEAEYAKTTNELHLGSWTLAKDTVAGVTIHWLGKIDGKSIVETRVRWRKGDALEPVGTLVWAGRSRSRAGQRSPRRSRFSRRLLRGENHG